jgi:phosphoglycolate phosphatase-like HAD superfamily hydrolase
MRPTVLLFDLDGTLLDTGGAGRRAIERAFGRRFARPNACDSIRFDGMTDRAIVRAGLEALGEAATDTAITELIAMYVEALEEEVARAPAYRVLAGVDAILDACAARARVAIGLGTGNVRDGARIKLGRARLFERFSFGGYGCDAESRPELLRKGAERGAFELGVVVAECRVVVIGDTPKDIAAAQAIGCESVAVATGSFSVTVLRASSPTHVVETLAHPDAITAVLSET